MKNMVAPTFRSAGAELKLSATTPASPWSEAHRTFLINLPGHDTWGENSTPRTSLLLCA
jgi:hypothetical protein